MRAALSRQGATRGSLVKSWSQTVSPLRIAVPVGPRPRSESAQTMSALARYSLAGPAQATGRTVLASSCSA